MILYNVFDGEKKHLHEIETIHKIISEQMQKGEALNYFKNKPHIYYWFTAQQNR